MEGTEDPVPGQATEAAILEAAETGDLKSVNKCVKDGCSLQIVNKDG